MNAFSLRFGWQSSSGQSSSVNKAVEPIHRLLGAPAWIAAALAFAAISLSTGTLRASEPTVPLEQLQAQFSAEIRPLLENHCTGCHNKEDFAGDLDLARLDSFKSVRLEPALWQNVVLQVDSGEMPPASEIPLADADRERLLRWARGYLRAEAYAAVGDPGPLVLRRLSNAEYTYTLRDLTGIESLDPAAEFPSDGAAGEGFSNASAALVMSPALFAKYLDAAKKVSQHMVLLPDGIEFSPSIWPRDWTESKLAAIRALYGRYSVGGEAVPLTLQGLQFATHDAGIIPLADYLQVSLEHRELRGEELEKSLLASAAKKGLSPRYLLRLDQALRDPKPSILMDPLRAAWQAAGSDEAPQLAAIVNRWQEQLWRFSPVGHIGKVNGPQAWQEAKSPLVSEQTVELRFPTAEQIGPQQEIAFFLATASPQPAGDVGPSSSAPQTRWQQGTLELVDGTRLPLHQSGPLAAEVQQWIDRELPRTDAYLDALATLHAAASGQESGGEQPPPPEHSLETPLEALAAARNLHPGLLARWGNLLQIAQQYVPEPRGHYTQRLRNVAGYEAIQGWGSEQTPSLLINRADEEIRFITLRVPPRSVVVHPSPDREAVVYWQAPIDLHIEVRGLAADADPNCGNGFLLRLEHHSRRGTTELYQHPVENGGEHSWNIPEPIAVRQGDLLRLAINARSGDHACDTTHIALSIAEASRASKAEGSTDQETRQWDLASEIVDRIDQANPLADRYGNPNVWHLAAETRAAEAPSIRIPDSALARWRAELDQQPPRPERLAELARRACDILAAAAAPADLTTADAKVREQGRNWFGPLRWLELAQGSLATKQPAVAEDLVIAAPQVKSYTLPSAMIAGGRFTALVRLDASGSAAEGTIDRPVQVWGSLEPVAEGSLGSLRPGNLLVAPGTPASDRLAAEIRAFQELFPAALCYTKIVPIDEVVTLRLQYREDEPYRRLMLSDEETATLERLWNELTFISREPLQLVDAYEQLWQYATQDADPSAFEPLREPFRQRAEAFRGELIAAQQPQLEAVVRWAAGAWRRPLAPPQREQIIQLYDRLRADQLDHDAALRLTLARILSSPQFLYKLESTAEGTAPVALDQHAVATRLSYFLWSSTPDARLRELAEQQHLVEPAVLAAEVDRMLDDPRARRLAIEFGCQWLGVRDFDQLDEKSETHFPQFVQLRGSMYEETIRFLTDFFQRDASVLSLLDADHTFVDASLAEFYGWELDADEPWQRIDGVQARGRGGILGLATTLARQAGASRTSAILRGNWVYESILGMHLPNPPSGVPQLPEELPAGLTERELIELHSRAPDCAHCHAKIDPFGFALEGFDAIGRQRPAADTQTALPDGTKIEGLSGLRDYLVQQRRGELVTQFCRKLLGFALGRTVVLTDQPLLDAMVKSLEENDFRVSAAIKTIVTSPQFLLIRGRAAGESELSVHP